MHQFKSFADSIFWVDKKKQSADFPFHKPSELQESQHMYYENENP